MQITTRPARGDAAADRGTIHLYQHTVADAVTTTASDPFAQPTVRRAERADLIAIYRIERTSFDQPWPYAAFEGFLGSAGFLVAADPGVVGYVVADVVPAHGRDLGHIKDLAVSESRRGEGIGSLLLRHGLSVLERHGAASVKLEVRESNEGAIGLYRSLGFEHRRTLADYYGDGEDALVFVRPL